MENLQVEIGKLNCDAEGCGYSLQVDPINVKAYVGALCPDCGAQLLTQKQYDSWATVFEIINSVQSLVNQVGEDKVQEIFGIADEDMNRRASFRIKCDEQGDLDISELKWRDN